MARVLNPKPEDEGPSPRPRGGMAHVSEVLAGMVWDPELTKDARRAIREGREHEAHEGCPCIDCHRAFGTVP